jgi:site-specific DNA-methyltransferase (adenine-specific)
MKTNALYYGDNLDILREHIDDESIDLVYLDPPFNSNRDYNVIFKDESGRQSDASIQAFEDTWHWGPERESTYEYLTNTARHHGRVPEDVSAIVGALRRGIKPNQMLAYVVEMTVRLVELRRVLKPTGSLYLHCDPTASHYLKLVLDSLFGPKNFVNEIVWERTASHNLRTKAWVRVNDVILFYSKTDRFTFNPQYTEYGEAQMSRYKVDSTGRRYKAENLTFSSPNPTRQFEWRGAKPPSNRSWGASVEQLEAWFAEGRILLKRDGSPRLDGLKIYLDDTKGKPVGSNWSDIPRIGNTSAERLGWQTQKPLALLERIVNASSNPGDIVLDPFCGCGTALVAAQKLKRRWIGIDLTYLAIAVMEKRLNDHFPELGRVEVVGRPTEVGGARRLAQTPAGRYQFQWFALTLVGATPAGGVEKVGADKGVDGVITFTNRKGEVESVIVSVKSGKVNPGMVQSLLGTVQQNDAAIGIFVTLEEPSKAMRAVAAQAGLYHSDWDDKDYPRLQVLSLADLLERDLEPTLPPAVREPYAKAQRIVEAPGQERLFDS